MLSMEELSGWAQGGPAPVDFSPMGDRHSLLVNLEGSEDDDVDRIADWMRTLVCPVIGVGSQDADLAGACDVIVDSEEEAALLVEKTSNNPVAATMLIQVLRTTEDMPIAQALMVESLAYATLQSGKEYTRWLARLKPQLEIHDDSGPAVETERSGDELLMELNRPSNRNAMSVEMRDALNEALQLVLADDSIESVHIRGQGKCFSTGGDLSEFGTVPDPAIGHMVRGMTVPGSLIARCAHKVTAHLHGACIGSGVEFPAFAGRVVARKHTHFLLPEVNMGLIPGAGGCISIARRMGRQRTGWLALSGQRIRAEQALEWGLVDAIEDETEKTEKSEGLETENE